LTTKNPNAFHSPWARLTPDEQRGYYVRRYQREEPVVDLARELGMKPQTLDKRLRELHQIVDGLTPRALPHVRAPGDWTDMPARGETRLLANPTDVHGVYADPYAWELALKCIALMRPDWVMWGNDAMDMGIISTYSRIGALPDVQEELDDEVRRRRELQHAASGAEMVWVADNHTVERYVRYIFNRAGELASVRQFQFHNLVGFPRERVVETFFAGETLRVIHGQYVQSKPGASVLKHILDDPANRIGRITRSVLMGHTHRFAFVSLDNGVEGLECGCLQNLRPDYLKAQRVSSNWRHGMGFARYGRDWSQIIPAPFFVCGDRLCCRLEGKELSVKIGRDYSGR